VQTRVLLIFLVFTLYPRELSTVVEGSSPFCTDKITEAVVDIPYVGKLPLAIRQWRLLSSPEGVIIDSVSNSIRWNPDEHQSGWQSIELEGIEQGVVDTFIVRIFVEECGCF
jgi:hypothetical protein